MMLYSLTSRLNLQTIGFSDFVTSASVATFSTHSSAFPSFDTWLLFSFQSSGISFGIHTPSRQADAVLAVRSY